MATKNATDIPKGISLDDILSRVENVTRDASGQYRADCPAHESESKKALHLTEGDSGQLVLYCFAGCTYEAVLRAVDLWSEGPSARPRTSTTKRPVKDEAPKRVYTTAEVYSRPVYEFRSPSGDVLYVQRHKGPYFRPIAENAWIANLDGVTKVPYNLPELIEGVRAGKTIFHVEGCKDAETAKEWLGVTATTTGGVKSWRPEFAAYYVGANVVILPDNDAEGRDYARTVAESLCGVGCKVKMVELPGLPLKGDLTDFKERGGTKEEALEAIHTAALYSPEEAAGDRENDLDALGVVASSVTPEEVEWLWDKRIPKGKLTILDGDPDMGKSVVTIDTAARVSTGRGFPDGAKCEAGNVIIVNVEDGIADTIVPRLKAAGADLERILILPTIPDGKGGDRLLDIPADVPLLEQLVRKYEAALLIIDPVLTMLTGDANKDQDARKALLPVAYMAERTGCAVTAVRHLNKAVGLKAIQRGGGNMGLIGVARAGSFFAKDPEDETRRIMAPHKSNLAEKPPSLLYRIVTAQFHNTARIEWEGASEYDADGLAADASTPHEKSQLDDAKNFLYEELKDGPMWAKQVFKDARDAGIAERTLYRAKAALKVRSKKEGVDAWVWVLPRKDEPTKGPEDSQKDEAGNVGNVGNVQNDKAKNSPYLSEGCQDCQGCQEGDKTGNVRQPSDPGGDKDNQGYQRPLSFDAKEGEPTTLAELKRRRDEVTFDEEDGTVDLLMAGWKQVEGGKWEQPVTRFKYDRELAFKVLKGDPSVGREY
jgi:putative DNA primase/helicase